MAASDVSDEEIMVCSIPGGALFLRTEQQSAQ